MNQIKPELKKTYLAMIRGSTGSQAYRQGYATIDGVLTDVMEDGNLSCAFFVSSILKIFDRIESMHAVVGSTITDMTKSGWVEVSVDQLESGDVLLWEDFCHQDSDTPHPHIGFYLGDKNAISNDYKNNTPIIHSYNYDGKRQILKAFRYPNWEK